MKGVDFFNTVEYLEPACPKCGTKIEYDITTQWSDELETHVCRTCGTKVD